MERSGFLTETGSWNDADAGFLKQLFHVEEIGFLTQGFGFLDCFLRNREAWECIHGTGHRVASEAFERVESVGDHLCLGSQLLQNLSSFFHV